MRIRPLPVIAMMSLTLVSIPAYKHFDAQPDQEPDEHSQVEENQQEHHEESHRILVTSPVAKQVTITQTYVCQIHSHRHIEVCALENGYLEEIPVKEGQDVRQGQTMFRILPTLYKARLAAEKAEVQLAQIEFNNTASLFEQNVVAQPEVSLAEAKLAKAQAKMELTQAELDFTTIKAPFDGIIDHQHMQQGSLVAEGDILTTLSDNKVMWAYFNVPEARYLDYIADPRKDDLIVELRLANGETFSQVGTIGAIEADFNNETGNIAFRADFPNPDGLLRHGQTGTILLSRVVDAVVIPQRATFEILAKKYAYVVGEEEVETNVSPTVATTGHAARDASRAAQIGAEYAGAEQALTYDKHVHEKAEDSQPHSPHGVVRQREIILQSEQDDIYLIKDGLTVNDKIVLEGIRQVRDGDVVEFEFRSPEDVLGNLKYHAE